VISEILCAAFSSPYSEAPSTYSKNITYKNFEIQ
jgi:hypothetical protein